MVANEANTLAFCIGRARPAVAHICCPFLAELVCPRHCAGSTATGRLLQSNISGGNVKAMEGVATIGRAYRLLHKCIQHKALGQPDLALPNRAK